MQQWGDHPLQQEHPMRVLPQAESDANWERAKQENLAAWEKLYAQGRRRIFHRRLWLAFKSVTSILGAFVFATLVLAWVWAMLLGGVGV